MSTGPESAAGFEFVGHTDQGGRSDGTQIMVAGGHAYIGQPFSHGVSVVDVSDPRRPQPVGFLPTSPTTWSLGVQAHGDLLVVTEEFDFFTLTGAQATRLAASTGPGGTGLDSTDPVFGVRNETFTAGLRVYDISEPGRPRAIGFSPSRASDCTGPGGSVTVTSTPRPAWTGSTTTCSS
jgi:hypothetical protein